MNRVARWTISLVVMSVMVLTACAAPQKPAPAPTPVPEKPAAGRPSPTAPQLTSEQQLVEAAKKEGEVVFWSFSFVAPEGLVKAFQEKYPFVKWKYWDAGSNPEIVARVTEETKISRYSVDVIHLTSIDFQALATQGLLKEYDWPNTKNWIHQPSNNLWRNTTASLRSPIYNTEAVAAAEAPKSWDDLKNTKWRGKSANTNSARNFPLQTAYLWGDGVKLDWEKSESFWTEVVRNTRPRMMSGFTGPTELLAAGEFSLFLIGSLSTYTSFVMRGAPVRLANVGKTTGSPHGLTIMKNAPHPNAARLLVDFMTSEEGLLLFANQQGSPALSPQVAKKAIADRMLTQAGLEYTLMPDKFETLENRERTTTFWNKLLEIRG